MSLIVLFGLPGTGKTYVGEIFKKHFGYYFYEGDNDLTPEMKEAIRIQKVFTDQMRDIFFEGLTNSILKLKSKYDKIVVAQTFIKERYRINLISKIPETKFILIETESSLREKRLTERTDYPLEKEYARKMVDNFDRPEIDHWTIINDISGKESIKKQVSFLEKTLSNSLK